jgi:hypothetical protein
MKVHGNAALGPAGRLALVEAIESGMTLRAAFFLMGSVTYCRDGWPEPDDARPDPESDTG